MPRVFLRTDFPMLSLLDDTRQSARSWRKWYLFGMQGIRAAYARSRIGHFWITLLFLTTVVALGFVYTTIWQARTEEFLPFFALSQLIWVFFSGIVLESTHLYQAYAGHLKVQRQPLTLFVFSLVFKHLVVLAHNAVVVVLVYLYFRKPLDGVALLAIPGLLLVVVNSYWIALVTALVCARFRDIPSVVASIVQILFFVTPILWPPSAIKDPVLRLLLVDLNPIASLMAVTRDPLIGAMPEGRVYVATAAFTLAGLALAGVVFAKTRRRLVYWI